MSEYTVHLVNIDIVRPSHIVRATIVEALSPLILAAGHEPCFMNVRKAGSCDVSIEFIRDFRRFGAGFMGPMILAEQSGTVLVGSILELRVRGPGHSPSERVAATRPLFVSGEIEFARTVGNVVVHELGHTIGNLAHVPETANYLYTGAWLRRDYPERWFTYENLRAHWAGPRVFNSSQQIDMVDAIRGRELRGIGVTRSSDA